MLILVTCPTKIARQPGQTAGLARSNSAERRSGPCAARAGRPRTPASALMPTSRGSSPRPGATLPSLPGAAAPGFGEGRTELHVPLRRAPSLPPHLHLNLSPALRTPGWHILEQSKGRTFLPRLLLRVEPIYGGAGGAGFSTLDWCVCFKSGGWGGFANYTLTRARAHTHARAHTLTPRLALPSRLAAGASRLQLPLPSWSTSSPYSLSPRLPLPSPPPPPPSPLLALPALALAAPGSAARLSFFLSLSPQPLID